jgi:hypothetical protein
LKIHCQDCQNNPLSSDPRPNNDWLTVAGIPIKLDK